GREGVPPAIQNLEDPDAPCPGQRGERSPCRDKIQNRVSPIPTARCCYPGDMQRVAGTRSFLGCAVVLALGALLCWIVFRPSASETAVFVCSLVVLRYAGIGIGLLDRGEVSIFRRPITRANFLSTAGFFLALALDASGRWPCIVSALQFHVPRL
ncbi:MAG: hypothetical protein ACHQ50_08575, partial [Fimbriimonadales bacterium]